MKKLVALALFAALLFTFTMGCGSSTTSAPPTKAPPGEKDKVPPAGGEKPK